jgi:GntR family transcriptional regulator, transcriptional repressor for pyruvate dehydrogenase complex
VNDLFAPLENSPAYRQIAQLIERKIVKRELRAGDALPSETDLARQFGVNRSTVREAIRELETHGLLGRGAGEKRLRVTRPEPQRISSGVSRAMALHDVSFLHLWEAMLALEPAAAEWAAIRRTPQDLEALHAASARFKRDSAKTAPAVQAVVEFFVAVGVACGNPVLAMSQAPLNALLAPTLTLMIDRVPQARSRIESAQKAIIVAIKAGKRQAARTWMERHIRDFKRGYELAGLPLEGALTGRRASARL